ncbi:hypothetical protein DH2020_016852 [Rehmannia glutinosa]|uniref:Reverse transcriptase domain-containing protein n=1 Tax=Rehmannia glutinosa TaxID=99300 RepID=A0ABR0WP48_REHGL
MLGSGILSQASCQDFRDFLEDAGLFAVQTMGNSFTWFSSRTPLSLLQAKLDRALTTRRLFSLWQVVKGLVLPRISYDRHPILVSCLSSNCRGPVPFRFQHMWIYHESFRDLVASSLVLPCATPNPLLCVMWKLKRLRQVIKTWNTDVFGDVNRRVENQMEKVQQIQADIETSGFIVARRDIKMDAQNELSHTLLLQSEFLKQKAHMDIIRTHIREYYENLFSYTSHTVPDYSMVVTSRVGAQDNASLTVIPSDSEIKEAIFDMDSDSSLVPDGFNGIFYRHFWDVISAEITAAVRFFFSNSSLPLGLNASFMALIPKTEDTNVIENFRPIVMSNFLFKIITKILATSLGLIIADYLSPTQFGFIPGRQIHDCIAMISEGFNVLQGHTDSNIILKIDIRKAFDTLRWDFLLYVLRSFGF